VFNSGSKGVVIMNRNIAVGEYSGIEGVHNLGVNGLGKIWAVNHDGTVDLYRGKSAFREISADSEELAKSAELYAV
jgi:hypothetical protein